MKRVLISFCLFLGIFTYLGYKYQDFLYENIKELLIPFTKKPTISVLMSSYNMGDTLPRAINSIMAQTYTDWEIILINDGSTDNTKEALRPYRKNLKIRTITNNKNLGLIPSLNKGLKRVRGKFIARHDADDISYPTRFERSLNLIESKNLDLVGAWCKELNYWYNTKAPDYFNTLGIGLYVLTDNVYCQSTTLIRKSFLDEYDIKYNPEYLNAEDLDFWMQMFLNGAKFGYMGGPPLSKYTRTTHSDQWFQKQFASARKVRLRVLETIIPNCDRRLIFKRVPDLLPYIIEGNEISRVLNQEELIECQKTQCYKWEQTLRQNFEKH